MQLCAAYMASQSQRVRSLFSSRWGHVCQREATLQGPLAGTWMGNP